MSMCTCTWLNLAAGMAIFSTVVVGSLVDHNLQQQASVAGQHILCLLAGQLLRCQFCPFDGPLPGSRDHRCCRCRGPGSPILCHRGGQSPGGRLYAGHLGRPGQGELLWGLDRQSTTRLSAPAT